MKNKNELSITDQIKIRYAKHGFSWILTGILRFFDNIPCRILSTIALAVSIYFLVKYMFANKEAEDEMATQNLWKAKAYTLDQMKIIFCLALLAMTTLNFFTNQYFLAANIEQVLVPIAFLIMGVENFLIGIIFHYLDKE